MPIYEYRCTECEHRLEKLQRMADDPLLDCPSCEKPSLKKLVSAAAFKLKGSGWYETDFKNKDKSNGEVKTASDSKVKDDSNASDSTSKTTKKAENSKPSKITSSSKK